ncbi:alpha-amylase [Exophiala aquamarina CBS 119918]|uniref:Alpha-amylase n=1 Tax=Exophiala aquamarina CBS 119918 TaxID=1182545 RepID=A0A072PGN8_9EURO|nr:alpha-amylase [Exophiala aquamarina CBS 119918]KEF54705.1 alpha-amylase [Exophiala aquamarina CBS 119918]
MGDPTPENYCMLQGFEWNVPADQKQWARLQNALEGLKKTGVDNVWLPPACKGAGGGKANGYDVYDLYDIGEFEQKGSRATKWGTREELDQLAQKAEELGVGLYFDAVLNHKAGADNKEKCRVIEVDQNNRTEEIGEPKEIEAWLGFDFPGRGDKYSSQKYHWEHFSGTDYDAGNDKTGIYRILGDNKHWSNSVGDESGNADFLMFADVDYSHPEVIGDVIHWGEWVVREFKLRGFRFDACQHFSERFTNEFVANLEKHFGEGKLFLVGEFWVGDVDQLLAYLDEMHHKFSLYDTPLLNNFSQISTTEKGDLRKVFDKSLVQAKPDSAVTVVMNHDTQPGQTVATPIEGFFKPLAYALILLRNQGYPCVFYGDLYGIKGEHEEPPSCGGKLPHLILARKLFAYGDQDDYFDDEPTCLGFVRRGTHDRPDGLAVVLSNAGPGQKRMFVGDAHKGEVWSDILGWQTDEVTIEDDGFGDFMCSGTSVSVWVKKDAELRKQVDELDFDDDIYKSS